MRQLSNLESMLLLLGGLLMVIGSGASLFLQPWAPYVFAPGALLFVAMQLRQRYEKLNQKNQAQIRELDNNPKAIEKIARERYFMKTDEEDIFVLSDDQPKEVKDAPAE